MEYANLGEPTPKHGIMLSIPASKYEQIMTLRLVDVQVALVEAWKVAFSSFPEVAVHSGDILSQARTLGPGEGRRRFMRHSLNPRRIYRPDSE
jgi:hypothetical protein